MSGNKIGWEICSESCIVLENGDKWFVDNPVHNIEEQMKSDKDSINVELTSPLHKGKKRSIEKKRIKRFFSNE